MSNNHLFKGNYSNHAMIAMPEYPSALLVLWLGQRFIDPVDQIDFPLSPKMQKIFVGRFNFALGSETYSEIEVTDKNNATVLYGWLRYKSCNYIYRYVLPVSSTFYKNVYLFQVNEDKPSAIRSLESLFLLTETLENLKKIMFRWYREPLEECFYD